MRNIVGPALLAAGAVMIAMALYLLLAMPGLISDPDSTVPVMHPQHAAS